MTLKSLADPYRMNLVSKVTNRRSFGFDDGESLPFGASELFDLWVSPYTSGGAGTFGALAMPFKA